MISKGIAQLRRLPEGAFIQRVSNNTPASEANLQAGDIITKFSGKSLNSSFSLGQAISKQKVGDSVDLEIDRNGKTLTLKATLAEMPQNP
jgi:serine protease Do